MTITIRIDLEEKEFRAIEEFAKMCGESMPVLMRKIAIRDATLADGCGTDDPGYGYKMTLPVESNLTLDKNMLEEKYNRIRRIMGWSEIKL